MKSIKKQISDKFRLYDYLFICCGFSVVSAWFGGNWESWVTASVVIIALIDLDR